MTWSVSNLGVPCYSQSACSRLKYKVQYKSIHSHLLAYLSSFSVITILMNKFQPISHLDLIYIYQEVSQVLVVRSKCHLAIQR